MKFNLKLTVLVIAACIVALAGCTKNSASIVGIWTLNTEREILKVTGTVATDTTINAAPGSTASFAANGTYITAGQIGPDTGTYVQGNGKLTLTSTVGSHTTNSIYLNTLTDHALQLEMRDTGTTAPISTIQYQLNFTR